MLASFDTGIVRDVRWACQTLTDPAIAAIIPSDKNTQLTSTMYPVPAWSLHSYNDSGWPPAKVIKWLAKQMLQRKYVMVIVIQLQLYVTHIKWKKMT